MSGWLFLLTTALLFGPKLMSLAWTLIDRDRRAEFGGSRKLAMSVLTDIPLAALMAPAMMVTQIGILIGLLSGKPRSEEHTSELQSLMRISYAVFCLTKQKTQKPVSRLKQLTTAKHNEQ